MELTIIGFNEQILLPDIKEDSGSIFWKAHAVIKMPAATKKENDVNLGEFSYISFSFILVKKKMGKLWVMMARNETKK